MNQLRIQQNLLAQKKAFYAALSIPYIDEKLSLLYKHNSDSIDVLKFEKGRLDFEEDNDIINILMIVQELRSLKDFLNDEDFDNIIFLIEMSDADKQVLKDKFSSIENLYFKHHNGKYLLPFCALLAITMEYIEIDDF